MLTGFCESRTLLGRLRFVLEDSSNGEAHGRKGTADASLLQRGMLIGLEQLDLSNFWEGGGGSGRPEEPAALHSSYKKLGCPGRRRLQSASPSVRGGRCRFVLPKESRPLLTCTGTSTRLNNLQQTWEDN